MSPRTRQPFHPFKALMSQVLGQATQSFVHEDPQATVAVRVIGRIQEHLFGRWAMAQATRLPCAVVHRAYPSGELIRCIQPMAATCSVCAQPCCLTHASCILETGDLVCFGCIERARQSIAAAQAAPRPSAPDSSVADALKLLGLDGEPDEKAIRAAYRKAAVEAHPDRHPEGEKKAAQQRFVALGKARDVLLAACRQREAA